MPDFGRAETLASAAGAAGGDGVVVSPRTLGVGGSREEQDWEAEGAGGETRWVLDTGEEEEGERANGMVVVSGVGYGEIDLGGAGVGMGRRVFGRGDGGGVQVGLV